MKLLIATSMLTVIAVGGALLGGPPARAENDATRTLDRTYRCAVFLRGGAYLVEARAHAGTRRAGAWARLPYVGVRTGVFSGGTGNLLAWITSGEPTPETMIDQDYNTFDVKTNGTVGVRRESCRPTSLRVPLAIDALIGGAAPPLGDERECFSAKQVVVRVRATLGDPGSLRRGDDFEATHTPVREAKLAVRTLAGKPLVYADVHESGKARLFTAKGCSLR